MVTSISAEGRGNSYEGGSYEEFVLQQLELLRSSLLQRYEIEVDRWCSTAPPRKDHPGVEPGVATASLDEYAPLHRWIQLTNKILDADVDKDSEDPRAVLDAELSMLPVWNFSLQEMQKFSRPRNYRTALTDDALLNVMRMNDPIKEAPFCLQRLVLKPNSWQQLLWTTLGAMLILWDLITIPLGFFDLPQFLGFLTLLARFSFAYWCIDVPLHLVFGVEVNGAQELRPKKLLMAYLRSWFLIDLFIIWVDAVIITLEVLQESNNDEFSMWRSARFFRILRLLRLLRLLRVTKLQNELMILANRFLSTNAFLMLKVGAGLFMMFITNHIIACCWYGVGSFSDAASSRSWLQTAELDPGDFGASYSAALHWSLTQFTPATNNIAPESPLERVFALVIILLAIGVFSSFIASISSTLNMLRASRVENSKHYSKLFQFFNERNLSVNLYGKVKKLLRNEHLVVRVQEAEVALIEKIPERLKIQLHMEMYMPTLLSMKIWPKTKMLDVEYFYSKVCHLAISEGLAKPGQDVFMPGTDCKDAYLLESGDMFYLPRQGQSFAKERGPEGVTLSNEHLCVVCLWAEWHHRGRLSSGQNMSYFIKVNCETFGQVAMKFGGPLFRYLQIFGILLVSEIEYLQEQGTIVSDMNLEKEQLIHLAAQAERYSDVAAPKSAPNKFTQSLSRILTIKRASTQTES